jgi:hypothetical protein
MKKVVLTSTVIVLVIGIVFYAGMSFASERMPKGEPSPQADSLAMEMLRSLNIEAWNNTTSVSWTFREKNNYVWTKSENIVNLQWKDHEVILRPDEQSGMVVHGERYSVKEVMKMLDKSWKFFNNDSYWLCAPFKVFDPGTVRSIVTLADGRQGLMVTYTTGGSTPGDTFVWILDENNRPKSVKMWVSILPIKGIEFTWENYITLSSGAMIAQDHRAYGLVNIELSNIR